MRIDWLEIEDFKNLKKFRIDFDETQLTTVLIGQNGTGKSNLFEALVLIFRALDLNEEPPFAFRMRYLCRGQAVEVWTEAKAAKLGFRFKVGDTEYAKTRFMDERISFLPQHVFAYYSGPSQRLAGTFEKHLEKFYRASTEGRADELRRLFLCRGVHSHFVMLAFYAFEDQTSRKVLRDHLQVTGLDSVLFVLKKPHWYKKPGRGRPPKGTKAGDERFFGARGMVQEFLDHLWDSALAPMYHEESVRDDYRTQATKEERLFLFVKDQKALSALAKKFGEPKTFFANLETTELSDLIREVRIRVQREGMDGFLTFKELSEGEQQLLAVLGLLKFTQQDESLFLLDEPDTHLNPVWKLHYLKLLQDVVAPGDGSQLLIATHDPLVIGGLIKEQVRILVGDNDGRVRSQEPDIDPRGLGFAGLLKSELYGLRSTVDPETLSKLDRRYALYAKGETRTKRETQEMERLATELAELGFAREFRDPYFEEYIRARAIHAKPVSTVLTPEEQKARNQVAAELVAEVLAAEGSSGAGASVRASAKARPQRSEVSETLSSVGLRTYRTQHMLSDVDRKGIDAAYEQASKSRSEGGIPLGAALVSPNGEVVAIGHNRLVQTGDPTAHAESICIRNAGRRHDWHTLTLVSTLSPCPMCCGIAVLNRIPRVVIGENRTFVGREDWLRAAGIEVVNLDDERCVRLLRDYISEQPQLWAAEMGVPPTSGSRGERL